MNGAPFHPQGFCQHGESPDQIDVTGSSWAGPSIGKRCHLGLRIRFDDLPHDCQIVVLRDYCDLWDIALQGGTCQCNDEFSNRYELLLHLTRHSCGRNSVYSEIMFEPVIQSGAA